MPTCVISNVAPISCEWNEWTSGVCSKECGGGIRTQFRTKNVEEANGGTCEGESTLRESCNTHNCPSKLQNPSISIFPPSYTFNVYAFYIS